jgi:flagellar biosynthesis GTPase FlhF
MSRIESVHYCYTCNRDITFHGSKIRYNLDGTLHTCVLYCYICCVEVTFHGDRIRYNLDGTVHVCREEDKRAYRQYCDLIHKYHGDNERLLRGEEYWKYRHDLEEQQRPAAEEQRRKAQEEEQKRAEEQRRKQRKQAANEKRRATRERKKREAEEQRHQEEEQRRAAEEEEARRATEQQRKRGEQRQRQRKKPQRYKRQTYEGYALKVLGLTHDIFRLASQELEKVIKQAFRALALKFHPDRPGGSCEKFREINEAYEFLVAKVMG